MLQVRTILGISWNHSDAVDCWNCFSGDSSSFGPTILGISRPFWGYVYVSVVWMDVTAPTS